MSETISRNKRIAQNTILLYIRTFLLMAITLYTSRVVLETLGVNDYGIYNVVGGFVAMFAVISGALSSSISRFITYELGHGDKTKLNKIFSTSVNIQFLIGLIILIIGESIGIWFLNNKMNIPVERIEAANWIFQCSLLSFIINLISVPYNAAIIAHEKMKAFAYISILEAIFKLLIVYILIISQIDKLILYAILNVIISLTIRLIYSVYCNRNFTECHYSFVYDKSILKEMTGYAGWSFLTNASYILNTQGINILVNIFFGVAINAARGIATQVDASIMQFVNNFTTAINPQIIKLYANNEKDQMFKLVCHGAKYSYFLLLFFAIPFICETDIILRLWLKNVPEHTTIFLRLSVMSSMMNILGNTQWTACQATGKIRNYTLIITPLGCLVFPLTWIFYKLGFPVESAYYIFIFIYLLLDIVRLFIMKKLIGFPIRMFVNEVFMVIFFVTLAAIILPITEMILIPQTIWRLPITFIISSISILVSIYLLGLSKSEKEVFIETIKKKLYRR